MYLLLSGSDKDLFMIRGFTLLKAVLAIAVLVFISSLHRPSCVITLPKYLYFSTCSRTFPSITIFVLILVSLFDLTILLVSLFDLTITLLLEMLSLKPRYSLAYTKAWTKHFNFFFSESATSAVSSA